MLKTGLGDETSPRGLWAAEKPDQIWKVISSARSGVLVKQAEQDVYLTQILQGGAPMVLGEVLGARLKFWLSKKPLPLLVGFPTPVCFYVDYPVAGMPSCCPPPAPAPTFLVCEAELGVPRHLS